ncbi:MAG: restriction endonuclease subunit S [Verrucomicrobia bacterium]|nr:restriction endonuclease subunit S [Verrucomicrobiota bacterium]
MKTIESRERGSAGQHQGAAMKKGWEIKALGELCDVLDSKRKPITKRDRKAGDYPYYGATGVLDHVAGYLFDEPLVLVGEDGAKWASGENTAFAVEGKIWVNNHAHVLRPHRNTLLDNWLIYHLNHTDLTDFVSGLTVPKLNQGSLREIPIPVPPLAEQQRIVGLLNEAFEGLATAKANAEKNLQNARALFESHLQAVFTQRGEGWVETTLGDICVVDWGNTDLTKSSYVDGGKYLAVSAAGCDGRIGHKEHAKHTPVLSAIGAQCGRMFLPEEDFTAIKNTITLTPRVGTCAGKFLYRLLTHVELPKRGAAQPFIAKGDILKFQIVVPEDSEAQLRIVDSLDELEEETQRLARLYERKLAALEELKKSLLHQAFSGDL